MTLPRRWPKQFSIVKQLDKLKGKNRWRFIVKAPDKSLQDLDKKWKHEHWYWQTVHIGESVFRCGTCVDQAQVNGACLVEGLGKDGGKRRRGWMKGRSCV